MASETECEAHLACLPFQGVTWAQEAGSWVCPQIFYPSALDLSALFSVCCSFFFFFDLFVLFCFLSPFCNQATAQLMAKGLLLVNDKHTPLSLQAFPWVAWRFECF